MRIVTFSTLYPNGARPNHGIFVETRLRQLLASGRIEAKVVAPVPWFPWRNPRFGRFAAAASAPRREQRYGIDVLHPRYLAVPGIGRSASPVLLAAGALPVIKRLLRHGFDFDLIDAHYFYPDGVAAALLGARLNKPVVITARGTDINLFPRYALPRKMIQWAAARAAAIVTVSAALNSVLAELGVERSKVTVLRNGVDTRLFRPSSDRMAERARLRLAGTVLLMVGNLVPLKGHHLVIAALGELPDAHLLIIGEGAEEGKIRDQARMLGVSDRVTFLGGMAQERLAAYYAAADVLVLASSREGWPNVLLESMACGTPVVATSVGGTPEIVAAPEAGMLMSERSTRGCLETIRNLLGNYPQRAATRIYAERFGWEEITAGQLAIFGRTIESAELRARAA